MKAKGFTLIELLVAMSLIALVSGAAVAVLAGGLRVWERYQVAGVQTDMMRLGVEQIRKDLVNARRFDLIHFEGSSSQFQVPATIQVDYEEGGSLQELGQVSYFADRRYGCLGRSQAPFSELKRHRAKSDYTVVIDDLQNIKFSYFGSQKEESEAKWTSRWKSHLLPQAVKIELQYGDGTTEGTYTSAVTFSLPGIQ
ncbi:MAG: prepilin-type N-terminal cleavage/methylation domain-containing protein [Candidatus Omnitrophica bacterium]|nr:prepilin-type N-terminal cleavage/methylation domain-containing protein [Candidatus Omnitrophota bacterium]